MLNLAQRGDYRLGFTTLADEVSVERLPVSGRLPVWLEGTLLRNGPAQFEVGAETYRHWFDGLAMVHRFTIGDGTVGYANRFLHTPAWTQAQRTGRIARSEFATDARRTVVERLRDQLAGRRGTASDNANVNIVPFAGECLALTETPGPIGFDPHTLETRGLRAYDDRLAAQITTAHPHHDRARSASFNVLVEIARESRYHVVRIADGTLRRESIATIAVDLPGYLHAFSTTERYVIVVEYPLVVRPLDLAFRRKPYIENYRWRPERGTRIHVIAKDGGALVGRSETAAFFAFHHINAFEERDAIVIDIAAYADAAIIDDLRLASVRATEARPIARAVVQRLRLVPGHSEAQVEQLADAAAELPSVARERAGRTYAFAYGVDAGRGDPRAPSDGLVKVDVRERSVERWSAPLAYPGEPVFVARPGATEEDDGVVLSVVLDAAAATSYLLVLDARSFAELARVEAPHPIPFGFHGIFLSRGQLRIESSS